MEWRKLGEQSRGKRTVRNNLGKSHRQALGWFWTTLSATQGCLFFFVLSTLYLWKTLLQVLTVSWELNTLIECYSNQIKEEFFLQKKKKKFKKILQHPSAHEKSWKIPNLQKSMKIPTTAFQSNTFSFVCGQRSLSTSQCATQVVICQCMES